MSQVSGDAQQQLATAERGPSGGLRRLRHEAAAVRAAARAVPRRTVVAEALVCALAAGFGLIPLLLVPPERPALAVLEALWATLLVPARRGRPVAAILCASPLLVGENVWTLAVVPLIVLSATRRIAPTRRTWQVVGVACAAVGVLTVARSLMGTESLALALAGQAVSVLLLLLLPALAGTLLGRRRPLVGLLRERNAYLEQARTLTAAAARTEERTRIAGEMHDLLGHRLSLISVHAGALELATARQAPPLVGQAELLRTTAGTALQELREILGVLRHTDATDETGGERGTREDIAALVTESRQTGCTVELDWSFPDTAEVDPRTRQAIHRMVREGLTNVLKHASGAPTRVAVRGTDEGIEVSVTNTAPRGPGLSHGGNRSGLAGLQERIALLGGTFEAGAPVNGGFRVAARLPYLANGPRTAQTWAPEEPLLHVPHLPAAGAGPSGGTRAPMSTEILTWPRVLGAGCAAMLVVLPTAGFLVFLLVATVLGGV